MMESISGFAVAAADAMTSAMAAVESRQSSRAERSGELSTIWPAMSGDCETPEIQSHYQAMRAREPELEPSPP